MLIGLLTTLLIVDGMLLALLIFIQKGKGSMGLGALGGGAQTLFGGSGGQDLFQKVTWVLGCIFMAGSLGLAILKSTGTSLNRFMATRTSTPITTFSNQNTGGMPLRNQRQTQSQAPSSPTPTPEAKK